VEKEWAADKMEGGGRTRIRQTQCKPGPSTQSPHRPHGEPPGRLLGDTWKYVLEKIVKSEEGKRKYPARRCHVCATHKEGVKLGTFVSSA
jgi:hypothetical protein